MCNSACCWPRPSSLHSLALLVLLLQLFEAVSGVKTERFCGVRDYWNSSILPYSFSNDAWGDDGSGFSCLQVDDNGTSWDVVYQWRENYYNVHGYPHMQLENQALPLQVKNLASLRLKATWSTVVASAVGLNSTEQEAALDYNRVRSNVAIDMFLDQEEQRSLEFRPSLEIMIWLWSGKDIDPVGATISNPNQQQFIIDGMRFFLYQGFNNNGQNVFSWLPENNVTTVDADFSPLIHYLWQFNMIDPHVYLGSVAFGTETFFAYDKTIFSTSNYLLNISSNSTQATNPLSTPSAIPKSASDRALKVGSGWILGLLLSTLAALMC